MNKEPTPQQENKYDATKEKPPMKTPTNKIIKDKNYIYRRGYFVEGTYSGEHGRSIEDFRCPFCREEITVYIWSFAGGGKRCDCGAWLGMWGCKKKKLKQNDK